MGGTWTNDQLDAARYRADPVADAAVAAFMEELQLDDPGVLFHRLVAELNVDVENQSPALQEYLRAARAVPEWADPELIERGQRFFATYLVHQFAMLFLASLPSAYAAARGAHPLVLTAQLTQHVSRRINETAQFVMDVNSHGAFDTDGVATHRIEHVRLMHAAVRWLIANDPTGYVVPDADPAVAHSPPVWADTWGVPINQEDLAGTLLTFTTVVFNGFDRCDVNYSIEDRDAYFHLWLVVATMLGLEPELTPSTVASAQELQQLIWTRQHMANAAGHELEAALLQAAHAGTGRFLGWLYPTMARVVLDPGVADMVGVPQSTWQAKIAIGVLQGVTRVWSTVKKDSSLVALVVGKVGRQLMDHTVSEQRHGRAVPFSVPTSLVADPKP